MKGREYLIIIIAVAMLGGILFDALMERNSEPVYIDSPVKIQRDTVRIDRIIRDTVILTQTRLIERLDTVMVQLPGCTTKVAVRLDFEEKTYKGKNYQATVFGYKPELRNIDVFAQDRIVTETRTRYEVKPPKIQAGLVAGAVFGRNYESQYVGARVRYNYNALNFEGTLGFDPFNNKPLAELRAGIDLFR